MINKAYYSLFAKLTIRQARQSLIGSLLIRRLNKPWIVFVNIWNHLRKYFVIFFIHLTTLLWDVIKQRRIFVIQFFVIQDDLLNYQKQFFNVLVYALLFIHPGEVFGVFCIKFRDIIFVRVWYYRGIKLVNNFVYDGYVFEILIPIICVSIFWILTQFVKFNLFEIIFEMFNVFNVVNIRNALILVDLNIMLRLYVLLLRLNRSTRQVVYYNW